ncbi:hypothetical protein SAMN06269173_11515 [Hymenobacter mucosus]|uniref:Uncharacterized protein n=1 Tax=Hymenobacter mucosus TaxID=1411120 RepID=A0A239ASC2_9BACT|nr:hypothetical protein SAMN06269173_11515 [Hymenobacter mucosus]
MFYCLLVSLIATQKLKSLSGRVTEKAFGSSVLQEGLLLR